jgi:membrane protease YdiL (CAAX protease family)
MGPAARAALVALSLVVAGAYRASIAMLGMGVAEYAFLAGLAALLLVAGVTLRRSGRETYAALAFAFLAFVVAGFAADVNVSPLQRAFVVGVLHESPSAANPLAATVPGTVWVQTLSTATMVAVVVIVIKAAGGDLQSLYLSRGTGFLAPAIGLAVLVVFYYLAARGRMASFFPGSAVSLPRLIALTPALIILVLMNGLREELWFRGLFLQRYATFIGPWGANVLAALVFASFHVQVQYAVHVLPFLGYALLLGLVAGYLMHSSQSLIGSVLLHAGTDIPIFLGYLAAASI